MRPHCSGWCRRLIGSGLEVEVALTHGLLLAVRALRWRWKASAAVLVVAVLASAAAALGPLYSRSAQDSLLRDRLTSASPFTRSIVGEADLGTQPALAAQTLRVVEQSASDQGLQQYFGAVEEAVGTGTASAELTVGGQKRGYTTVGWSTSTCTSVRFTAGRCPTAVREVAVSQQTFSDAGLALGATLTLGLFPQSAQDRVYVVGVYDRDTARAPAFAASSPAQAAPPAPGTLLPRLDQILTSRATVEQDLSLFHVTTFRRLRPGVVHVGNLPALSAALTAGSVTATVVGLPEYTVSSPLPALITSVDAARRQVADSALVVTAQLVLLSWFVLFLVVAATTEERSPEVALAKLRGMRAGPTALFALTEPLLLLTLAAPLGLVLAVGVDALLVRAGLGPGTQVLLDHAVAAAVAAAFAGGLVACALAARRVLGVPVLAELRRTGGRRARVVRTVAVDAVVVAIAAAGVWQLRAGASGTLVLFVPGLLALAVGVPAARLVPLAAGLEVRRTRRSARVGAFLAARNLSRRPTGARSVVLLTVAVALVVFAVDGWSAAEVTRAHQSAQQVGAATVLHVAYLPPAQLLTAVRAADPSGNAAMAAIQTPVGVNGALLAVDAARLSAVSAWNPAWAGTSTARLTAGLTPAAPPPLSLHGPTVFLTDRYLPGPGGSRIGWTLTVQVLGADGVVSNVDLGSVPTGLGHLTGALPAGCGDTGCALLSMTLNRPLTDSDPATGSFEILAMGDTRGPVPPAVAAPVAGTDRWRVAPDNLNDTDPDRPLDALLRPGASPGWFVATFTTAAVLDVTVTTTAFPRVVPVLLGSATVADGYGGVAGSVYATGLGDAPLIARPLPGRGVLPRVGTDGALADLGLLAAQDPDPPLTVDDQVWLAAGSASTVRARLAARGVRWSRWRPSAP